MGIGCKCLKYFAILIYKISEESLIWYLKNVLNYIKLKNLQNVTEKDTKK